MLCDGVFAIAMTLLVLDLRVPDLPKTTAGTEVWHALTDHGLTFFAFVLTFLLAGQLWILHHVLFHYLRHASRAIAILNLPLLMFVSLLPFTTSMFAKFGPRPAGMIPYLANQTILGAFIGVQFLVARRQGLLTGSPADPKFRRFTIMVAALPLLFGLVLVGELITPGSPAWTLIPGVILVRLLVRRADAQAAAAPV